MGRRNTWQRCAGVLLGVTIALVWFGVSSRTIRAAAPNVVSQWNQNAEDAVVRSGAFQNESMIYMGYVSAAVYDAAVAMDGGYQPYGPGVPAPAGASRDAAIVEAAYRSLSATSRRNQQSSTRCTRTRSRRFPMASPKSMANGSGTQPRI